jgi:hypothetical protein
LYRSSGNGSVSLSKKLPNSFSILEDASIDLFIKLNYNNGLALLGLSRESSYFNKLLLIHWGSIVSENDSEIVKLNIALCKAFGITSVDRCSGFDLKVRPGQAPVVVATYQIKDSDGLSAVVDEFNLVQERDVV